MWFGLLSQFVTTLVLIRIIAIVINGGIGEAIKYLVSFLLTLPGASALLKLATKREIKGFINETFAESNGSVKTVKRKLTPIPQKGISTDQLQKELATLKNQRQDVVGDGKLFAFVYTVNNGHFAIQRNAYKIFSDFGHENDTSLGERDEVMFAYMDAFMHDNALNPVQFPALRKFENEIVSMTADMLNGDDGVVGSVTSGGTESILLAVKTYRDRARKLCPWITKPNFVAPITIHPAFEKASHYFNVEIKHVPVDPSTCTTEIKEFEKYIDKNTILIVGSAPSYPQAILDPIEEIAHLALRHHLPMHVDACYGGFILPWIERNGRSVPKWDFRVDGVTSISADLHKYGFIAKGASVICYKNDQLRKFQYFSYSGWSGGLFAAPTVAGTRPGAFLAAAWAGLRSMGQNGYTETAKLLMEVTDKMKIGIESIPELFVYGKPLITGFGFGCKAGTNVNVFAIADAMEKRGWKLEVQKGPDSIHCSIMQSHATIVDKWIADLKESVAEIKSNKSRKKENTEAMYGMVAAVPNNAILDEFMIDLFSDIYK